MASNEWQSNKWYRDVYLKSQHWLEFAKVVRDFWDNKCALCYKPAKDIHHRTYRRLGNELLQDVILLCRSCHDKFHNTSKHGTEKEYPNTRDNEHRYIWVILKYMKTQTSHEQDNEVEFVAEFQELSGEFGTPNNKIYTIVVPLHDVKRDGRIVSSIWQNYQRMINLIMRFGIPPCPETPKTDPAGLKTEAYWFAAMTVLTRRQPRKPLSILQQDYNLKTNARR